MIELHVGDNRIVRMICQKMPLELTRFEHEVLRVVRHVPMPVPDQKSGLFIAVEHRCDDPGRGRFAVGPGHADRSVPFEQMAEILVVIVCFHTGLVQGRFHFRMILAKGQTDDHGIVGLDVAGIEGQDLDAALLETILGEDVFFDIAAADFLLFVMQDLGQRCHAGPFDPYKVIRHYFFASSLGASSRSSRSSFGRDAFGASS